jgi:hypothetical protein
MRLHAIVPILAVSILTAGCALPRPQGEFDLSQMEHGSAGFVERVGHTWSPNGEDRVLVRLDNGFSVEACTDGEGFEPGERVRILRRPGGPRAARE